MWNSFLTSGRPCPPRRPAVRGAWGRYLNQLADEHGGVALGLQQDTPGDRLTVVEGLGGQPHVRQAARVDELEHLRHTHSLNSPCVLPNFLRSPYSPCKLKGSGCFTSLVCTPCIPTAIPAPPAPRDMSHRRRQPSL